MRSGAIGAETAGDEGGRCAVGAGAAAVAGAAVGVGFGGDGGAVARRARCSDRWRLADRLGALRARSAGRPGVGATTVTPGGRTVTTGGDDRLSEAVTLTTAATRAAAATSRDA